MIDLPPDRPMPDHLQNAVWDRVVSELPGRHRRKLGTPLTVASAVGVLAVGATVLFGPVHESSPGNIATPAGTGSESRAQSKPVLDAGKMKLVRDCVSATIAYGYAVPDRDSWRPAAEIDRDTRHGFLVIRNDTSAAVCVIDDGVAVGMMGADVDGMTGKRYGYAKLTPERPFNCFTGVTGLDEPTFEFGIVTNDVSAVSLVGPDNSVHPATMRDGTFAAKINRDARDHGSYRARMTMKNGHVLEAPLILKPR
ncbi:hypothetical protein AB0L41_47650 [Amycolatopsis mediterranei]|uniref:hypothetical protein n=1 Tax=Amycolatopsis mediterranei TaxID=33910 RepID=UPI00343C2CBC